ncbi:repetitive organellar protein-like [Condylostylus longicornis]|uniref:repetitive organellar protein-like n=1 Tax=Condylostylus longicornis TaxID=2530218 RepID=UPI00244DB643|nr:repetitive organellar protein-like [Condylostylus longicornis]
MKPYRIFKTSRKSLKLEIIAEEDKVLENIKLIKNNKNNTTKMALDSISTRDLIMEARSIPIFNGDGTFELTAFIREADAIIGLTADVALKSYLKNIILSKIQGEAAISIRRLENATWDEIKTQLTKSFGIPESYLKLKEMADAVKFINLDPDSPIDFKPSNNEHSILEKFLNKLPRSDNMYLRIKGVKSLEEAYSELCQTGITNQNHAGLPNQRSNRNIFHNNNRYNNNNNNYNNSGSRNVSNFSRSFNNNYNNSGQSKFNRTINNFSRNSGNNYNNSEQTSDNTLPIVEFTIGNKKFNCLIDTGSTTSIINDSLFPEIKKTKLKEPVELNTLFGKSKIYYTLITDVPIEFNHKAQILWRVINLKNKNFDAILGQNVLRNIGAKIDLKQHFIEIMGKITKFKFSCPYEVVDQLYSLDFKNNNILDYIKTDHLNNEEHKMLKKIVYENRDLFYQEGQNLTNINCIKHQIITTDSRPVYSKIYRFPKIHELEVENQVKEMLSQGIIKHSSSPYNSPIWVVPKKLDQSGQQKWRIVVDYRKLNEITVEDKFPIPNIESLFDKLGKAQYFTTLDLAKGFHQILVDEKDQQKTAFSTPQGHYEFVRMPFGLKNAPATFQRMINYVLRDFININCVVYLDDILIFKSEYLGHLLTDKGIRPNPKKIDIIKKLKLPNSRKSIKSFLGITGYYRKFIKDYAKIAQPLTYCLKKDNKIDVSNPKYIAAFEKLKEIITSDPILRYPNFNYKFTLTTDASDFAIGAVLSQNGHPISFASRTLNDHETRYSTIEKELLAIVWSTKYFRPYLYGVRFTIKTDHRPLVWLNSLKEPNSKLQRWRIKLNEFNFDIEYVKGKDNKVADFLSRINVENNEINVLQNNVLSENQSGVATIHSGVENLGDHIPIVENIVNKYLNQIHLVAKKPGELIIKYNKYRKIFISEEDLNNENYLNDFLRRFIKNGTTAIYSELNDKIALRLRNSMFGKPKKFIFDNEFDSLNTKDFCRLENIELHFTSPRSHTGNSDIERAHGTVIEHIRILTISDPNLDTESKILKAVEYYNNTLHSVTEVRPSDFISGKISNFQEIKDSSTAIITLEKIDTESGFTTIQQEEIPIVESYTKILHIIDLNEIEYTIKTIESYINESYKLSQDDIIFKTLTDKINKIKHTTKTLIPYRHKRALMNVGGSFLKWIFGTMDEDDKIEIEEHMKNSEQNTHNLITNYNNQIKINDNIQNNLNILQKTINKNHILIDKLLNDVSVENKNITKQLQYLQILTNINLLNDEIEKIQENVIFSKHQIMSRSILTPEEIDLYDIDVFKIQELKSSLATTNDNKLVFVLAIPILSNEKAIKYKIFGLPNSKFELVDIPNSDIISFKNKTYYLTQERYIKKLQLTSNCISNLFIMAYAIVLLK